MFINSLMLAISSSIDSFGIGITYGIKGTKISNIANLILFAIAFIVTTLSIYLGNTIKNIFSPSIANLIGSTILIAIGLFMFFQSLKKDNKMNDLEYLNKNSNLHEEKIYKFFIRFLGITIQIIKNPNYSDFDNSKKIDSKEAIFLGLALSLDSLCIGTGSSIIGIGSSVFPLFTSVVQLFLLQVGNFLGKKIKCINKIPDNIWSILSSILLICIGILKLL